MSSKSAEPRSVLRGEEPAERIRVHEHGVAYWVDVRRGHKTGFYIDQRDNRRRWLVNHVADGFPHFPIGAAGAEVLNTFAYTCGFSVCAARAGGRVTSIDLSRKYLEWGKRNFVLNGLDPARHVMNTSGRRVGPRRPRT